MPKQLYTIRDWSGGISNKKDPRDIKENENSFIQNMSINSLGKIKTEGGLYAHSIDSDGSTSLSNYIVERTANIQGAGGYGLTYFEADHNTTPTVITETKSGTDLAVGTGNGQLSFVRVVSNNDENANNEPNIGL
tara:strand:+ start:23 stop:427 length:405 start_codon:yes stop_codon:yes gene_type:complete